jgi:hypothetical protein
MGMDERIKLIHDALTGNDQFDDKLPGLESLLADYLSDDVEVGKEDFHRRLLRVFRDSKEDNTYQDILSQYSPEERARVEDFVNGKDLDEVSSGFEVKPSIGVREHMESMLKADFLYITADGPVHSKGLSMDDLKKKDGMLHKFVSAIFDMFKGSAAQEEPVLVSYSDAILCLPCQN